MLTDDGRRHVVTTRHLRSHGFCRWHGLHAFHALRPFHAFHRVIVIPWEVGPVGTLEDDKGCHHDGDDAAVEDSLVAINHERSQEEVVNQEQQQENGVLLPYEQYVFPQEWLGGAVQGTHI